MGATEKFARFVVETESRKLPEGAIEAATTGLMDAVGTALAGTTHDIGKIMVRYIQQIGGTPTCRVIGTGVKTSAPDAALANGTLGHADDYDDVGDFGHPAVVLMPTVLALGEQLHKSGREVLDAYALGYEVGARIGHHLGTEHYERGWHTTAVVGTIASAAAASRLMGLDVMKTRIALGIAASHAAGVVANFGTMTKPLHPGNGARSGVVAATLASMGFTANPDSIESPMGYVAVLGSQQANVEAMTVNLGSGPYLVASPGPNIKEWPCCYNSHGAIPMAVGLVSKYEISPEQVETVEFMGYGAMGYLNRPNINTYLGGKFSLQFAIAAALVDRGLNYATFSNEKINDPQIQKIMKRVVLRADPMSARLPAALAAANHRQTLTIRLKDGREVNDTIEATTNTLRGQQVDAKFEANARRVLSPARVKKAHALLRNLKQIPDVTEMMDSVTLG